MKRYLDIDTGHWSDNIILALLPPGGDGKTDTASEDDMPMLKKPRRRTGWHAFRWIQDNSPGMDAEHLMRRYGIPVADRYIPVLEKMITGRVTEVGFSVPRHQAVWAEYLLCRAGWAVITPLLEPSHYSLMQHARREGASRPIGGGKIKRRGIVAKYYGFMDELIATGEAGRERCQPEMQQWKRLPSAAPPPSKRTGLLDWLTELFR